MSRNKTTGHTEHDTNKIGFKERAISSARTFGAYWMQNPYGEASVRVAGTILATATACYPIGVIQNRKQIGEKAFGLFLDAFYGRGRARQSVAQGLKNAYTTGFFRSCFIANKEALTNVEEIGINGNKRAGLSFKTMVGASGIIAGLETFFTQVSANSGVFNSLGITLKLNLSQKIKFLQAGLGVRGFRNYVGTMACITASAPLSDYTNNYISRTNHPIWHNTLNALFMGIITSPILTSIDNVYKHQVKETKLNDFSSPSALSVTKDLWRKGKVTSFTKGGILGCVYTVVSIGTVNGISFLIDNVKQNLESSVSECPSTLFADSKAHRSQSLVEERSNAMSRE